MNGEPSVDDAQLLGDLSRVLTRMIPTPTDVVRAAKGLFTWRAVDSELAALAYDSLLDDSMATARSAADPRIVAFEAGGLTVEVEVDDRPGGRRLIGQLVPAQPARLELRQPTVNPTGAIATTADDLGRFLLPLPAEPTVVRVRVTTTDGRTVESSAVAL